MNRPPGDDTGADGKPADPLDHPLIDPEVRAEITRAMEEKAAKQGDTPASSGAGSGDSRWPRVPARSRRKKVVLADPSRPITVLQPLAEVEEQTSVGEYRVESLMRQQLRTALLLALLVVVLLGSLPAAAYISPAFANLTVIGVRLPWLLLGVLPFPLLFGVGFWYHKLAERHEKDFVKMIES
jgi:hypothetical protein